MNEKPKKVEIVCLGNNGRSPIAESVFRDEAKKLGVYNQVDLSSSGLYAFKRHTFDLLEFTIKKAMAIMPNLYGNEKKIVEDIINDSATEKKYASDPKFQKQFLYYLDQAYRPLQAMDIAFRNNVLARHGLEFTNERRQFEPNQNLNYILTATKKIVKPIQEQVTNPNTIVTSLGDLTGTEDIPGGFGKFDIDFYENMYQGMRDIAPVVLDKVLR